jgi:hypothetical protein
VHWERLLALDGAVEYRVLPEPPRYRDLAIHPDGKTFYVTTDVVGANPGAILEFRYLDSRRPPSRTRKKFLGDRAGPGRGRGRRSRLELGGDAFAAMRVGALVAQLTRSTCPCQEPLMATTVARLATVVREFATGPHASA